LDHNYVGYIALMDGQTSEGMQPVIRYVRTAGEFN